MQMLKALFREQFNVQFNAYLKVQTHLHSKKEETMTLQIQRELFILSLK